MPGESLVIVSRSERDKASWVPVDWYADSHGVLYCDWPRPHPRSDSGGLVQDSTRPSYCFRHGTFEDTLLRGTAQTAFDVEASERTGNFGCMWSGRIPARPNI